MLEDNSTPSACASSDPAEAAKADDTVGPISKITAPAPSPAEKADHTPTSPPEKQEEGTSMSSPEGASKGTPTHRLGDIGESSEGAPVSSHEGTTAPHTSLYVLYLLP